MDFRKIFLGILIGVSPGLAINQAATEIGSRIKRTDVNSLLENCLATAVSEMSPQLNDHAVTPGGEKDEAYLDRTKLHDYLHRNPEVKPLSGGEATQDSWEPYLNPFLDIIVIPGCALAPDDHRALIRRVLECASSLFNERVPCEHPAFEQLVLKFHTKFASKQEETLREINMVGETTQQIKSMLTEDNVSEGEDEPTEVLVRNPFAVVAADALDLSKPSHVQQIKDLFVSRYTDLETIRKGFNTILEGQRGTGKTMIMKHLAFETQILEWTEEAKKESTKFFLGPNSFIGIYSKLRHNVYDKADFEAIEKESERVRIFEHRLVLQILYDTLQTMKSVFQHISPRANQMQRIRAILSSFLMEDHLFQTFDTPEALIIAAQDCIAFKRVPEVDQYLGSVVPGYRGAPPSFAPWLTLSSQLIPFLQALRDCVGFSGCFFLMLDDFDVLEPEQQACIFRTAAERDFSIVCFKIGYMVFGKKTSLSAPGRTFRAGDDYDHINLDWTQGGLHRQYQKAISEIVAARLKAAGWTEELSSLLPEWARGSQIFDEVKQHMEKEWDEAAERRTQSKSDYISKYGNARFFQALRQRKIRLRYAGIKDVTMVSSGIIRQFLEACKLIIDRAHDAGWEHNRGEINPEIQDSAIREYSEQMIQQSTRTSGDAHALLAGDIEVTSLHMTTLIESLCDVFYSRLHTPGHGEPEIICISIRDNLSEIPEAETYLRIAVRESILHLFQYPPKSAGGEPLPAYMLNRRLGPRRGLSIKRMQGRIEIDAKDILLAVSDRNSFFRKLTQKKAVASKKEMLEKLHGQQPLDFGGLG